MTTKKIFLFYEFMNILNISSYNNSRNTKKKGNKKILKSCNNSIDLYIRCIIIEL